MIPVDICDRISLKVNEISDRRSRLNSDRLFVAIKSITVGD
jgi:hypothetical protein